MSAVSETSRSTNGHTLGVGKQKTAGPACSATEINWYQARRRRHTLGIWSAPESSAQRKHRSHLQETILLMSRAGPSHLHACTTFLDTTTLRITHLTESHQYSPCTHKMGSSQTVTDVSLPESEKASMGKIQSSSRPTASAGCRHDDVDLRNPFEQPGIDNVKH